MTIKEFREMSPEELNAKIASLKQSQFEFKKQAATGQLEHPEDLHNIRKDIAKALTVKRERELQINGAK